MRFSNNAFTGFSVPRSPTVTVKALKTMAERMPTIDGAVPDFVRRKSTMLFIACSLWLSVTLFAFIPTVTFIFAIPHEAWVVISTLCGVLGTLITTWLVKRFDARIAKRTEDTKAQTELLKSTIDWAVRERQDLYKETEETYRAMVMVRDKEIERLTNQLEELRQKQSGNQ